MKFPQSLRVHLEWVVRFLDVNLSRLSSVWEQRTRYIMGYLTVANAAPVTATESGWGRGEPFREGVVCREEEGEGEPVELCPTLHKVQGYTLYRHRGRRAAPTPST